MPFLREKTGRWSPEKIAAFAVAIAPALWLAGLLALDQLGARPVTEATEAIERMLANTGVLFDELTDLAANI